MPLPFIPAPNCVEVVLRFTWQGQRVAITLSFEGAAPATAASMTTLAGAIETWWKASLKPLTVSTVTLNDIVVTALDSASAPGITYPITSGGAGTAAGASVPSNSTITTTFVTALRGRSYRGRNYFVGLNTGQLQNAVQLSTTVAASILAAYASLPGNVAASGFTHVVISRFTGNAPRVTAVATPVTAYQQEIFMDSQRRRLAGRGL